MANYEAGELARSVLSSFRQDLSAAELYLEPSGSLRADCLARVTELFRCMQASAGRLAVGPLPKLYTADFDEDQVWEELQLVNEPALVSVRRAVERLQHGLQVYPRELAGEEEKEEVGSTTHEEEQPEEEGEELADGEEEEIMTRATDERCEEKSGVDDAFFRLSDMEQYLERAEQLTDPGSEGSVGMLGEELSDSDSGQLLYSDFFDPPVEVGAGEQQLSSYEKRKRKMAGQIQAIEEENVRPKSWQMSGEAASHDRPVNSLLEEAVEFEPMAAPAPAVTEETTQSLESLIKQRILDQAWDDVQRKVKPVEKPYDYKMARPLDQGRSQKNLAELYEEEYVHQTAVGGQPSEEHEREHGEIEKLKSTLFAKLDALTNFYFTPKPPCSEPRVVSNVSAVVMEEAMPSATAHHTLLAPEEVQAKSRVPVKGKSERTAADKRRQRTTKKQLKRRRGMKHKKPAKTAHDNQTFKSNSRQFFESLQHKTLNNM